MILKERYLTSIFHLSLMSFKNCRGESPPEGVTHLGTRAEPMQATPGSPSWLPERPASTRVGTNSRKQAHERPQAGQGFPTSGWRERDADTVLRGVVSPDRG